MKYLLAFLVASISFSEVIMIVTPHAPNQTLWTFSGNDVVAGSTTGATFVIDDDDGSVTFGWLNSLFYSGSNRNMDFDSTSIQLDWGTNTYDVLGVGGRNNIFGFAIDHVDPSRRASLYHIVDGDTISFSGSAILNQDISEFNKGIYNVSTWGSSSALYGALDATIYIDTVPVPEPSTFIVLLLLTPLLFKIKS